MIYGLDRIIELVHLSTRMLTIIYSALTYTNYRRYDSVSAELTAIRRIPLKKNTPQYIVQYTQNLIK